MTFRNRYTLKDREGEKKITRKFLLWPRTFEEGKTRWFEFAYIVEEVMKVDVGGSCQWGVYAWQWVEIGFTDPVKVKLPPIGSMPS
jgi:hypothetical protein